MLTQRREEKSAPACGRERMSWLWLLFLYVSLSLGLSHVNGASQDRCLFYPRFSPLLYFRGLFPSRSFSRRYSGLLFPILTTYHLHMLRCKSN